VAGFLLEAHFLSRQPACGGGRHHRAKEGTMPPRGVKSSRRKRQYEHIKESEEKRGNPRAEEIAARTVNKQRARAGETKTRGGRKTKRKSSGGGRKK
jgi:hypothetical protein